MALNSRRAACIVLLLVTALMVLGSCRERGSGRSSRPDRVEASSETLHIAFSYDRNFFTSLLENERAEFGVKLVSERYVLGLKKLSGVGRLLAKEPGSEFFKFFSGEVLHNLQRYGMKLVEQETVEDFTAQGRPGAVQFLHMQLPEDRSRAPAYLPADVDEVYLYYFHYYYPPDYWYFAAIARGRLSPEDVAYIEHFIDGIDFAWQAPEGEDGEADR